MVMANAPTTARKLGIAAQIAARHLGRSRRLGALYQAGHAAAAQFGRVLGQLWLEITGFIFLALAAFGTLALGREYNLYAEGNAPFGRVLVAAGFTAMFAWFGLSSFWRARKRK